MSTFEFDGVLRQCGAVLNVLPVTTWQSETRNRNQLRPVVLFEGRAYSKGMLYNVCYTAMLAADGCPNNLRDPSTAWFTPNIESAAHGRWRFTFTELGNGKTLTVEGLARSIGLSTICNLFEYRHRSPAWVSMLTFDEGHALSKKHRYSLSKCYQHVLPMGRVKLSTSSEIASIHVVPDMQYKARGTHAVVVQERTMIEGWSHNTYHVWTPHIS